MAIGEGPKPALGQPKISSLLTFKSFHRSASKRKLDAGYISKLLR